MLRYLYFLVLLSILTSGCEKKDLKSGTFVSDSIEMQIKYRDTYSDSPSKLRYLHNAYSTVSDSLIQGINHQLYSEYLARNTNFDSAYYYLSLADTYFKHDTLRLFKNSFKKIYITNRIGLPSHSASELNKAEKFDIHDTELKKLYLAVFSLPVLKKYDSIRYKKSINSFLGKNLKRDSLLMKDAFLENYKANQVYFFLLSRKQYDIIIETASKRLNELIDQKRTHEDVFFTHLFYIIKAKIQSEQKDVIPYFDLFETYKHQALTKETETLLYILRASYFEGQKQQDSVIANTQRALNISRYTGNYLNEREILKKLLFTEKGSLYAKEFINIHDSLSFFKGYMDDFIFSTNTSVFKLEHEQESIQKLNMKLLFLSFTFFFSLILCFLIFRNRQSKKLAVKYRDYLDKKAEMYNYLIEIKDKLDSGILKENEDIKNLIYTNALSKIDELLQDIASGKTNSQELQQKIIGLENESRSISHFIASDDYKPVDLEILLEDLKLQYAPYIKIEAYVDHSIVLNDLNLKELLRILLLVQTFLNKLKYKNDITCFISVYKNAGSSIFKMWINRSFHPSEEEIQFLQDRNIRYDFVNEEDSSQLLVYINK